MASDIQIVPVKNEALIEDKQLRFSHLLALSIILAIGILCWNLREIIIQIFAGIVIAMAICTLVGKLRSLIAIPRALALIVCLTGLGILTSIFLAIVVPPFTNEFQQLLIQLPTAAKELWELGIGSIERISDIVYGNDPKSIWNQQFFRAGLTTLPDGSTLANGLGDGLKKLLGLAGNVGSGLIRMMFILAIGLMISIQPKAYFEIAIKLFPSFYRRRARIILHECGNSISDWMVGVLISSFCVAILAGIGLSLLGVKLVIANALLAGMLNIIPNLGPVLSTIFPLSVALLDAPWKAIAVIGMYIFIQNLESYLITPSVMHHQLKLLPGLTLTAQFLFTIIFGPIGLLLALPLAVVMQVLIKEILIEDILDPWKNKKRIAR